MKNILRTIREIDFFDARKAHLASAQLERLETTAPSKAPPAAKLELKQFQNRTWLTRPRPEIDRVGSAWFIRHFTDQKARFAFVSQPDSIPGAIPFDYPQGNFSHQG